MLALPRPLVGISMAGLSSSPNFPSGPNRTSIGSRHDSNPLSHTSEHVLIQSVSAGRPSIGASSVMARKLSDKVWQLASSLAARCCWGPWLPRLETWREPPPQIQNKFNRILGAGKVTVDQSGLNVVTAQRPSSQQHKGGMSEGSQLSRTH